MKKDKPVLKTNAGARKQGVTKKRLYPGHPFILVIMVQTRKTDKEKSAKARQYREAVFKYLPFGKPLETPFPTFPLAKGEGANAGSPYEGEPTEGVFYNTGDTYKAQSPVSGSVSNGTR